MDALQATTRALGLILVHASRSGTRILSRRWSGALDRTMCRWRATSAGIGITRHGGA